MQQQKATPGIELVDHAGDNVRRSWKSSTAANTYASRGSKHGVQVAVTRLCPKRVSLGAKGLGF